MKLYGNYLSPYVRRVAISMNILNIPFELEHLMIFNEPDKLRGHNPVVRIPTLQLDDGTALGESAVMLDYLDQQVGPARALVPATGPERLSVMQITGMAIGATEKAQWAFYELRFHPKEKVHQPWIEQCEKGALGGLGYLNDLAAKAGPGGWLAAGENISQADISTVTGFSFIAKVRPNLQIHDAFPELAAFAAKCESLAEFSACPVPSD
jgi:glutathione S-transferase